MSKSMLGKISLSDIQGSMRDLQEKLAGPNGPLWLTALKKMLRGEQPWGIPSDFSVTTQGIPAKEILANLHQKRLGVGKYVEEILTGRHYVTTSGVIYHLAIIMGDEFKNGDRVDKKIRAKAKSLGYSEPPIEVVPYLRMAISDNDFKNMGLRGLAVMHLPIELKDRRSIPYGTIFAPARDIIWGLLTIMRRDIASSITVENGKDSGKWDSEIGFVFLVMADESAKIIDTSTK